MTTLYCFQGKLYSPLANVLNDNVDVDVVQIGLPLTCEYKTISISSSHFDRIGKSQIMIVTNVKNEATKNRVVDSITYQDDSVKPKKKRMFSSKGKYRINTFDASQYGYPVCFHTPGYQGTTITITTKMWEIDDYTSLKTAMNILGESVSALSSVCGIPYITLANDAIGIGQKILTNDVSHTDLDEDHTIEVRTSSTGRGPYQGDYICIPGLDDINEKRKIIKEYIYEEGGLYKKVGEEYIEYDGTYFVLNISCDERKDLHDFDFTASATDLLSKLASPKTKFNEISNDIINMSKDAYDMGLVEILKNTYDVYVRDPKKEDLAQIIALYRQLISSSKKRDWFDNSFPEIKKLVGL